jgi:hypothetical protein
MAAFDGHKDATIYLLDHGADINAKDNQGFTPLHLLLTKAISLLSISSFSEELISIWQSMKDPHL